MHAIWRCEWGTDIFVQCSGLNTELCMECKGLRTSSQNNKSKMTCLKLGCLNLKLHLHIGNGNMCGEGLIPCPPAPAPTFAFNDGITHNHQHAFNNFVLDLVKSCDSCNNNNKKNKTHTRCRHRPSPHAPIFNALLAPALNDPDIALNDLDLALNDLDPPRVLKHARPDTNYHTYQFYYPHLA